MSTHTCGNAVSLAAWRARIGTVLDVETLGTLDDVLVKLRSHSSVNAARTGHRLVGKPTVRVVAAATDDGRLEVDIDGHPHVFQVRPDIATWLVMVTEISCRPAEVPAR